MASMGVMKIFRNSMKPAFGRFFHYGDAAQSSPTQNNINVLVCQSEMIKCH